MSMSTESSLSTLYQKKDHLEHIYDIPDTYIGSIEPCIQNMWVLSDSKMIQKEITFIPGFFKIFDEILVNAIDHKQRDPNVKNIKVEFHRGMSEISVYNDGNGLDVEIHPVHKKYIPEMLFGELLTSTNYEKDVKRVTGGKNGYGAKLTNIFSKRFVIETVDAERKKKYVQEFEENMSVRHEPKITKCSTKPYTKITFVPDYNKFKLDVNGDGITDDIYLLFEKRVYDVTAVTPDDLNVYFNGEKIKIKSLDKYIDLFVDKSFTKCVDEEQERWKVGIVLSPNNEFMEMSFVNGIWTSKGGKHVEHILNQIVDKIKDTLSKNPKTKSKLFKVGQIKENIWLFVNSVIENPTFTSQTKEEMTTKISQFGSKWELNEKMVDKFVKSGFLERILENSQ